ncbi:MAG: iron-containing alcohol dehydrogenase [Eubacteriales bacterium]
MNCFDFYCPTKIEFGENAVAKIANYIETYKIKKPIVVTDKILMKLTQTSEVINNIEGAVVFDNVLPNPTSALVMDLKAFIEEYHGDGLIVFGGGSPIDSAKAASVVAYSSNDVIDYYDSKADKLMIEKALPIIAVPTTSGTGSEVSKYSVITDVKSNLKESLTSDLITPKVAVVDPCLMAGMPPSVTVSTGLDALSHALESLVSTIENPFTNVLALHAIELIVNNLNKARVDGNDLEARGNMAFAALTAGIAMSHCCGTMGHAMGCQLTSQYNVPHGLACAVIQKDALDYARGKESNIKMLVDYLDKANYEEADAVRIMQQKLVDLFQQLETKMNLADYQMTEEGMSIMTKDSMNHGCMGLNPEAMDVEKVMSIFKKLS